MKCDTCQNQTGYTLGEDECGAGSFFSYCSKGHWEDGGPQSEEEYEMQKNMADPWVDCLDYKPKIGVLSKMHLTSLR